MRKSELIAAIQKEILRHDFGTYVNDPPSAAQAGRGVILPGCTEEMRPPATVSATVGKSAKPETIVTA